jgi:hypothetical protein
MSRFDTTKTVASSVVRNGLYNLRHPLPVLKQGIRDLPKLPKFAWAATRAAIRKVIP